MEDLIFVHPLWVIVLALRAAGFPVKFTPARQVTLFIGLVPQRHPAAWLPPLEKLGALADALESYEAGAWVHVGLLRSVLAQQVAVSLSHRSPKGREHRAL